MEAEQRGDIQRKAGIEGPLWERGTGSDSRTGVHIGSIFYFVLMFAIGMHSGIAFIILKNHYDIKSILILVLVF